jgi:hypothetical protein
MGIVGFFYNGQICSNSAVMQDKPIKLHEAFDAATYIFSHAEIGTRSAPGPVVSEYGCFISDVSIDPSAMTCSLHGAIDVLPCMSVLVALHLVNPAATCFKSG